MFSSNNPSQYITIYSGVGAFALTNYWASAQITPAFTYSNVLSGFTQVSVSVRQLNSTALFGGLVVGLEGFNETSVGPYSIPGYAAAFPGGNGGYGFACDGQALNFFPAFYPLPKCQVGDTITVARSSPTTPAYFFLNGVFIGNAPSDYAFQNSIVTTAMVYPTYVSLPPQSELPTLQEVKHFKGEQPKKVIDTFQAKKH